VLGGRVGLALELRAWRRAGRVAQLWWRDDDARRATPALARLLQLSDRHRIPLALAAIPGPTVGEVAALAAAHPQAIVIQHGVDHENRRDGPAAGEFPPAWRCALLILRLGAGWAALDGLPATRKVFAPPWNDVHPELARALRMADYAAWTAWGELEPQGRPARIDAHLDLLRWRGGPRFRGAGRMAEALRRALHGRRKAGLWSAPIGLLTHHLDHDPAAWAYLERFLAWSSRRPALRWAGLDDLLPAAAAERVG